MKFERKKIDQKKRHHSGYPGGLKEKTVRLMLKETPRQLIFRIIKGMMPHTKLGAKQLDRLFIYPDHNHRQQAQEKNFLKI